MAVSAKEEFIKNVGAEEADALMSAVIAYQQAEMIFNERKIQFDQDTASVQRIMKQTKELILKGAEEHGLREIPAAYDKICEIKPRTTSAIDCGRLWGLAVKRKLAKQFYTIVKPQVTKAKALFGEKVLEYEGVLTKKTDSYHSIKIV